MRKRLKQTLLQRRHTDGQQTHEKMLNKTLLEKCKSKQNEVLPHTSQNVSHQKIYKQ